MSIIIIIMGWMCCLVENYWQVDGNFCSGVEGEKVSHNRPRWPKGFRVV